jgi:hypothetical protein
VIPYEYQVADGAFHHFAYVTQMSTYNAANSALYSFKVGARVLTRLTAPTSNPEMCNNPPPGGG